MLIMRLKTLWLIGYGYTLNDDESAAKGIILHNRI